MAETALDAVQRVASAPTILVALDFDGTLAPTVDDPETARAMPEAVSALDALAQARDSTVALVSGRSLEGLQRVAQVHNDVVLVGSHGAESLVAGKHTGPALTSAERDLLESLCLTVETVATGYPGARVERKPSGCGLHTRLSRSGDAEAARAEALDSVGRLDGASQIAERYGKDILEFTIRAADKGSALVWLREVSAASAIVFIGDDVTDEDGFRALGPGDVGVKVGAGDTAAEFRVADPAEVSRLLAALAAARADRTESGQTSRTT